MKKPLPRVTITKDISFICRDGWGKIRAHWKFLVLLWLTFYLPISLFSHFRLEPYLNRAGTSSDGGLFWGLILLNLLGTIPLVAVTLLIRGDETEYDRIAAASLRRLPLFLTTGMAMMLRMLLATLVLWIPILLGAVVLGMTGLPERGVQLAFFLYMAGMVLFLVRYASATTFYLMKDAVHFDAVRRSVALFQRNKKGLLQIMGLCHLLPLAVSFAAAYIWGNGLASLGVSLLMGLYTYGAAGIFANLFHYLEELPPDAS